MTTLSENIKRLRKANGYSGLDMAEKLDVSRSTWGNYENGNTEPDMKTLQAIADILQVEIADLLKVTDVIEIPAQNIIPIQTSKVHQKNYSLPETSIPVFNDGGAAGHAELYNDFKEKPAGFIRVPGYEDCDFATYAYGHSMYPVIESGCLILCRKTQGKQMIMWGEIYYIITADYRMIKRI